MPDTTVRKFTIYVVDDEHVIASTLAMILRSMGIDAVSFSRPSDALEAAALKAPDLLLTDVSMPLMTGIDLALTVKKSCPGCKVLLFSGQAATANLLDKATAAGHNFEILSKPVHPTDLLAKIRDMAPESVAS